MLKFLFPGSGMLAGNSPEIRPGFKALGGGRRDRWPDGGVSGGGPGGRGRGLRGPQRGDPGEAPERAAPDDRGCARRRRRRGARKGGSRPFLRPTPPQRIAPEWEAGSRLPFSPAPCPPYRPPRGIRPAFLVQLNAISDRPRLYTLPTGERWEIPRDFQRSAREET